MTTHRDATYGIRPSFCRRHPRLGKAIAFVGTLVLLLIWVWGVTFSIMALPSPAAGQEMPADHRGECYDLYEYTRYLAEERGEVLLLGAGRDNIGGEVSIFELFVNTARGTFTAAVATEELLCVIDYGSALLVNPDYFKLSKEFSRW